MSNHSSGLICLVLISAIEIACTQALPTNTNTNTSTGTDTSTQSSTTSIQVTVNNGQSISAAWVNNGEDKVVQEDLRVFKNGMASVNNSLWNGSQISLFGAKNEVVNFNLILEAASNAATNVSISFDLLTGPGGATIKSVAPNTNDGVFNWTNRNIENFYIKYLEIKGLSQLSYGHYDERHIPKRFQRNWSGNGIATGKWTDRPDHNKHYPDIAVPLELVPNFTIAKGQNQSIWSDIYIPSQAPSGLYTGTITVKEGNHISYTIPVQLNVRNFRLPDVPNSKTMIFVGLDPNIRYTGVAWPNNNTPQATKIIQVRQRHAQMAHRHKLSIIDTDGNNPDWTGNDQPSPEWIPRLDGSLFTAANGYDGPGINTGNGIYSIGTFGSWSWSIGNESDMRTHTNNWETWFQKYSPTTERFLYLADESTNYAQTDTWAKWISANPGIGKNLMSMATIPLLRAQNLAPNLSIATTWMQVGDTSTWQNAYNTQILNPQKRYFQYNANRPANGSFATEDDGIALRELSWAQYKKGVGRWMFWESTYYNDYQGGRGQTNVFQTAATFSGALSQDTILGEAGWNHSNGDGLLFYPGTDTIYPSESYNLSGPIASLRLKYWRRGVQDIDYLTLAKAINPVAVQNLVNQMVPKAAWEYGVTDKSDPSYVLANISWSENTDLWESARSQLAHIIDGK